MDQQDQYGDVTWSEVRLARLADRVTSLNTYVIIYIVKKFEKHYTQKRAVSY